MTACASPAVRRPRVDLCPGAVVRVEETATSRVLFTRCHVFKLRHPIRWPPYLDYTTPQGRWQAACRELERGRRWAPRLYQGLVWLSLADGGTPDAAVCMRRLPSRYDTLLNHLRRNDGVVPGDHRLIDALLDLFLRLHAATPAVETATVRRLSTESRFRILGDESQDLGVPWGDALRALARSFPRLYEEEAERRRAAGHLRELHGDLHTDNVLTDGVRYLPFDPSDFEAHFVVGDVAIDLGFLLADLFALGRSGIGDPALARVEERTATPPWLLLPMVVYGLLNRANVFASRPETRDRGVLYLRCAERLAAHWLRSHAAGAA